MRHDVKDSTLIKVTVTDYLNGTSDTNVGISTWQFQRKYPRYLNHVRCVCMMCKAWMKIALSKYEPHLTCLRHVSGAKWIIKMGVSYVRHIERLPFLYAMYIKDLENNPHGADGVHFGHSKLLLIFWWTFYICGVIRSTRNESGQIIQLLLTQ